MRASSGALRKAQSSGHTKHFETVDIFSSLNTDEKATIAKALQDIKFQKGECILTQGDKGEAQKSEAQLEGNPEKANAPAYIKGNYNAATVGNDHGERTNNVCDFKGDNLFTCCPETRNPFRKEKYESYFEAALNLPKYEDKQKMQPMTTP